MGAPIKVLFKKEHPDAVMPSKAHEGDTCYDLVAVSVRYDRELDAYIYDTGLACETACVTGMFMHPRSSNRKTNYYLTNGVGVIDPKEYRGTIQVTWKNRDSISTRIHNMAMADWDSLPWYRRIIPGSYRRIFTHHYQEFMANPLIHAPYVVGGKVAQFWVARMTPLEIVEVDKLSDTSRGTGGHGSSGQ